ncbi:complex I subunit 5 family protein [Fusibacter sp. JL298sf-3]
MMPHLLLFVMLPIITGLLLYLFKHHLSKKVAIAVQFFLFGLALWYAITLESNFLMPLIEVPLPFGMALRMDRMTAVFLLLSNFLFMCTFLFSYHKPFMEHLFVFLFLSLQGLINGIFLSTDFFNVYILIEVATITASILIMYKKDSQSMYDGMIYLIVNMVGMAFFLFGVGFLYKLYGVLDFESIRNAVALETQPQNLYLPFAFLLTGVGLKAALMPLFSWLPKAHGTASAPSIVSAILSGIFVKAGMYLLLRMQTIFYPVIDMQSLFLIIGFMTALSGFVFAISQSDIKLILAYHTVSQIGLILIGVSGYHDYNYIGGLYHIVAHGIFKSSLFLIAGLMIRYFKTRKIKEMAGFFYVEKGLSIALIIAILSITGAPFMSGGFSKYFIAKGYEGLGYQILFWLINIGTMTSFIKFFIAMFKPGTVARQPRIISFNERLVIYIMAAVSVFLGAGGNLMMTYVFDAPYTLSAIDQVLKLPVYLALYGVALLIYKYYVLRSRFFSKLRSLELTFNSISIAIVSFFFFTLMYLRYVSPI